MPQRKCHKITTTAAENSDCWLFTIKVFTLGSKIEGFHIRNMALTQVSFILLVRELCLFDKDELHRRQCKCDAKEMHERRTL